MVYFKISYDISEVLIMNYVPDNIKRIHVSRLGK
jgi:hypothetical protein